MFTLPAFLTGTAGRILGYLLAAILVASAGAYGGYRFEASKVSDMKAKVVQQALEMTQFALQTKAKADAVSLDAAVAEAKAQAAAQVRTVTITKEVPHVITKTVVQRVGCIPYGLVRLLDAAALPADPDSLTYASGQFDDTCSPVDAAALAESIIRNYGAAQANAEQLNALEAWLAAQEKVK